MGHPNTGPFLSTSIIVILEYKIRLLSGIVQMIIPFVDNTFQRIMRFHYSLLKI